MYSHEDVSLALLNRLYARIAQSACQDSVKGTRSTTPLQVSEDTHPHVVLRILVPNPIRIVHSASVLRTLRHDHDTAILALSETAADELFQLVHIRLILRDDGSFRARCDGTVLCEESRITAHHLHEEDSVV